MTSTTTAPETTATEQVVFEKGTWQHTLQLSATADEKVENFKELAGKRLWLGARAAITEFSDVENDTISTDPSGETLFAAIKETGLSAVSASKIKNVALAARDNDEFDWEQYAGAAYGTKANQMSLGKIDKIVRNLARAAAQPEVEAEEDSAADVAIQAIAEDAPKSANSVEGGIKVALAKAGDVDEFVKVLIDVLNGPSGEHNEAACRAFIRSFAAENAGRVKASKPAKASTTKAAPVGDGATKAKPAPATAPEAPAPTAPVEDAGDEDLWDEVDAEATAPVEAPVTPAPAKAAPAKAKAKPVARKA